MPNCPPNGTGCGNSGGVSVCDDDNGDDSCHGDDNEDDSIDMTCPQSLDLEIVGKS